MKQNKTKYLNNHTCLYELCVVFSSKPEYNQNCWLNSWKISVPPSHHTHYISWPNNCGLHAVVLCTRSENQLILALAIWPSGLDSWLVSARCFELGVEGRGFHSELFLPKCIHILVGFYMLVDLESQLCHYYLCLNRSRRC